MARHRKVLTARIGRWLRNERESQGMSGRELAERIGCSQARLSDIELGKLQPTVEFVREYVEALGIEEKRESMDRVTRLLLFETNRPNLDEAELQEQFAGILSELNISSYFIQHFEAFRIPEELRTERLKKEASRRSQQSHRQIEKGRRSESLRREAREMMEYVKDLQNKPIAQEVRYIISESALVTFAANFPIFLDEQLEALKSQPPNRKVVILPLDAYLEEIPQQNISVYDSIVVALRTGAGGQFLIDEDSVKEYSDLVETLWFAAMNAHGRLEDIFQRVRSFRPK